MSQAGGRGALSHWRVIDLSQNLAGAYCTKLMAGFGAEVIKIEPPGTGDPMRHTGPFLGNSQGVERSIPFLWYHTAKRSVTLDLASAQGVATLVELIGSAHIVVESYVPGRLSDMGLDFETLKAVNPQVILLSITPFGQTGPYRHYQAEDITLYAMSGLMYETGDPQRAPLNAGPAIAQLSAGMKGYVAALMAGLRTARTGTAEWIDVSIQEAAADNVEIILAEHLHLGKVAKRANDEHPLVPWRIFPCRDGYAAIMGGPIRHWLKAAQIFEEPQLVGSRYAHMEDRIRQRDDIRRLMAPWLLRHDKKEIFHAGQARGLAWGFLASLQDVLESPQFQARGYFVPTAHPEVGNLNMVGAPFRAPRMPWRMGRAPRLGEHTDAVLRSASATRETLKPAGGRGAGARPEQQPLAGVRIADFTHDWAGPHAVRVLADYGAEVVKIEYPKRLDGMRGGYLDRIDQHPRWWQINRNKKSITLDLHRAEHVEACKKLISTCDVVVDNSRPGVMEKFGLGYAVLKAVRPDVILISMSAHGATGPWSRYAGYGGAIEALSGVQSLTAYEPGGDPMRVREVDVTNGIMGACAIMTALVHRHRTGEGQQIDLSETETCTWLIGEHLLELAADGRQTLPIGNRHPLYAPQGCYRCRGEDRWLAISIRSDDEWKRLCRAIGRPEWATDLRFSSEAGRRERHAEIDQLIESWTIQQDSREATATLQAVGLAAGFVATMRDLAQDPHLRSRMWLLQSDVRRAGAYPGLPFRFLIGGGGRLLQPGPDLGQDNHDVLVGWLGLPGSVIPPLDHGHLGTAFDLE